VSLPQLLISPRLQSQLPPKLHEHYICIEWNTSLVVDQGFDGAWLFDDEWDQITYTTPLENIFSFTLCIQGITQGIAQQDSPEANFTNESDEAHSALIYQSAYYPYDYSISDTDYEQHWQEILALQHVCIQKCKRQKLNHSKLQKLHHQVLQTIPSLLALGKSFKSQTRSHTLWQNSLQGLEVAEQHIVNQKKEYAIQLGNIESCSLHALCSEVLEQLICPQSWLKYGIEELWVDVDIHLTRYALNLLISHLSQGSQSPTLRVTSKKEGAILQVEVDQLPNTYKDNPRFQQNINYARSVAELHKGSLWLTSTRTQGLSLEWFFPQVSDRKAMESNVQDIDSHGSMIWLIDDEASVRLTVKRWLLHLGYKVQTFEDGNDLIKRLQDSETILPILIICDADMPAMPGLEVLAQVFQSHPHIKRLLYTAREPNHWVIEAFNRGVIHRFIDKSQGPEALKTCMQELLQAEHQENSQLKELDELLSQDLVTLFLQPIFDSKGRKIEAAEALMRSKHPAFRGPLDILKVTQMAQRELDLQRVLTHHSRVIREQMPENIKLFMNIDPIVFSQPESLDSVFSEIYPYAHLVVLELTERGQLCGDVWVESVRYLRDKGFEIALDDLGAGYNSLGAVAAVAPEIIKLDISLVSHIHQSTAKYEMVRLLSEYAQKHQMKTVAEGIEMAEEASVCSDLNIKWLQGYHLARPMPFEQFKKSFIETL
jgi:EAL domain-containing protein (putative c-di-GMP-specific phosphodiesterase class I)/CheY-like chemotaxis protein